MKLSSMLLATLVFAVATPPAFAATIAPRPACEALLTGLAHCNIQTPDATRIACQKDICVAYGECLVGEEPTASIPQLSTLCHGLGISAAPSLQTVDPTTVTPVR